MPCIESILNEPLEPPLLCPSWKLWRVLSKKWNMQYYELARPYSWRTSACPIPVTRFCKKLILVQLESLIRLWIHPPPRFHPVQPFGYQSRSRCNLVVHPQGFNQFCPKDFDKTWWWWFSLPGFLMFIFLRFPHHHCDIIAVFPTIHLNQLTAASIARET